MSSFAWRVVAVIFLGLGLIGLLLPVVPQIPFLLLGAAAAAKAGRGSTRTSSAIPPTVR